MIDVKLLLKVLGHNAQLYQNLTTTVLDGHGLSENLITALLEHKCTERQTDSAKNVQYVGFQLKESTLLIGVCP